MIAFALAIAALVPFAGAAAASPGVHAAPSAPDAAPDAASIQILSSRAWTDDIGYLHIVGDVKNTTTAWRRFVEIDARLYNANGRVLKSTFTFTLLDLVGPGKRAPFHLITERPAGYHHFRLSTTSSTTSLRPIGKLKIFRGVPYTDSIGYRHYPGEVKNENGFPVEFTQVIITLFDANGRVLNVDFTFTDPHRIPAGAKRAYEAFFGDHYAGTATVRIQVQASRP